MMRSQASNSGQPLGQNENQKKSVFDRLGHQMDNGRQMKRRPSPGQYGDYGPPAPMHDPDYGRFGGRDGRTRAELEWRYQNERRMIAPFPGRDRHLPPPSMRHPHPPHQASHYDIGMANRQPSPYYPHPNSYHAGGPPGSMPPPMPPPAHYEMELGGRQPPPYYPHPSSYHANPQNSMPLTMPPGAVIPPMPVHQQRSSPKYDRVPNVNPNFKHRSGSIWTDSQPHNHPSSNTSGGPRYTRWRERRDVITNLDRETARSSSRTDSLKSSLQQLDSKNAISKSSKKPSNVDDEDASKKDPDQTRQTVNQRSSTEIGTISEKDSSNRKNLSKTDPQDISDGEIIDDEDSSDDEGEQHAKSENSAANTAVTKNYQANRNRIRDMYGGAMESHHYYENGKKRRLIEREDYAMDYETISDEDLDDFMGDKKMSDEDVELCNRNGGEKDSKGSSEIELLNALGLDWANLVEIAKQSKTPSRETSSPKPRFSIANYLPTLGITADLAGPELYDLVIKTCRTSHEHYQ